MPDLDDARRRSTGPVSAGALDPGRLELRGGVSRQHVAITIVCVVVIFGGQALDVLGADAATAMVVGSTVLLSGALAGAMYYPARRFWWRGAIGGVVVSGGAFGMHRLYSSLRPGPVGHEFAVVAVLGALPGVLLYYVLMRRQDASRPDAQRRRTRR